MRSKISSQPIIASCVQYSDRAYYGVCVLIKDMGRPLPVELQQCSLYQGHYILQNGILWSDGNLQEPRTVPDRVSPPAYCFAPLVRYIPTPTFQGDWKLEGGNCKLYFILPSHFASGFMFLLLIKCYEREIC